MTHRTTITIPDRVYEMMKKHLPNANWSAIASVTFEAASNGHTVYEALAAKERECESLRRKLVAIAELAK